ncbi:MAG: hypothetical protein ACXAAO_15095 [Candidatus Thorarchaeota archaeon]
MGLAKKLGIVVLLYVIFGFVLNFMYWGYFPLPGVVEDIVNSLRIIFLPINIIFIYLFPQTIDLI